MSNIIDKKAKVLVKSGGVTGQSTVCVFQSFDGSFHGSDVRFFRNFEFLSLKNEYIILNISPGCELHRKIPRYIC